MLNVNDSITDRLVAAHLDMHTRFPVTERAGTPQAIIGHLSQVPTGGEVVTQDGIRALVRKVRRQRVLEAQLHQLPASSAS